MSWFENLCVTDQLTIKEAMETLNTTAKGILLVVGDEQQLRDVVTDGDLRRGILAGKPLDTPLAELLEEMQEAQPDRPVRARDSATQDEQRDIIRSCKITHLPLVNEAGVVVDLISRETLLESSSLPVKAVVMAGGFGTRLRPLTDDTPKPMLLLDGKPLLERTVCQLREAGIRNIDITTHFHAEKIVDHFGDGTGFGVDLNYVFEQQPMGTAGGLRLINDSEDPLLVMNGDILTGVDYRALVDFHRREKAALTIGVRQYDINIPYGVVQTDGSVVKGLREKPTHVHFINAGIYLLEKTARNMIPEKDRFDMTDLIEKLLESGHHVVCFPIFEYWIDIGQLDDFNQAQTDVKGMKWAA